MKIDKVDYVYMTNAAIDLRNFNMMLTKEKKQKEKQNKI
jgi:hypothetical protein